MEFVLNLNLEIESSDDFSLDLVNNFKKSINLSSESLAILCLIDYCQLVSTRDFKCFCYYSKKSLINDFNNVINDHLNDYNLNEYLNAKYNHLNATITDLDDCDSLETFDKDVLDTNLPSLKRKVNDECTITITGLTSLFRDIIKIGNRLRPDLRLENLLVTYLTFLNIKIKAINFFNLRVGDKTVVKHVQKLPNGLIYVK